MQGDQLTVIASESCFASGVDHCLVSEDDHLMPFPTAVNLGLHKLRKQTRACANTIDFIFYREATIITRIALSSSLTWDKKVTDEAELG